MATHHRHVVLYDGVCGLCNRVVQFTLARDPSGTFAFATLQSDWANRHLAAHGKEAARLETFYLIADEGTESERLLDRSDAALLIAREVGWPWRAAGVFRILPRCVRDLGYRFVARIRYRVFGKHETCPIPKPEHRERFLDQD